MSSSHSERAPLSKQIAGAAIGGMLALVVYAGYTALGPQVEKLAGVLITPQARLGLNPEGDVRIGSANIDEYETSRIASKARQIAKEFGVAAPTEEIEETSVVMPQDLIGEEQTLEDMAETWEEAEGQEAVEDAWEEANLEFSEVEPDFYGETNELTDSGIGMWLATIIALIGATCILRRKKLADGA